jgi:hypothetical protein
MRPETDVVRILLALLTGVFASGLAAAQTVPLPRPRPAEAERAPVIAIDPVFAAQPREASACQARLVADGIAVIEVLAQIDGPNDCGAIDLVKLKEIVLADRTRVAVLPAPTLRCEMAEAVVHWVREDVAPAAATLGGALRALDNFDSYECRGRNRRIGARTSEHGRGNALDVRGMKLASGAFAGLTDRALSRPFRETMRASACARFTTVLGPGSDGYHEDHIHLDLAERRGGYRLCQWNVLDAVPLVPLPRPRPAEAPVPGPPAADDKAE